MAAEQTWPDGGQILEMAAGFRNACVLGAAAELDLVARLGDDWLTAQAITDRLEGDPRAVTILLDALTALCLLEKQDDRYRVPEGLRPLLRDGTPQTVLPMVRHSMTMLRNWSQLAWIAKAGIPGPRQASIRGFEADRAAFLAAMHTVSGPIADGLVARLMPLEFRHLLDVGGASGTWTLAFLRAVPGARATIFDLPDAIPQARARLETSELAGRVDLAAGDFYSDELPSGCDFVWLSAIIHQHSRRHNRELYAKAFRALEPGGRLGIRDIVMRPDHVHPPAGALFAVNMLANTESGGTFTFAEIAEDLQAAGFVEPVLALEGEQMDSVVLARRR